MQPCIEYTGVAPEGMKVMHNLERYFATCGLKLSLLDLIKTHASQIDGCAYYVDIHTNDARKDGS